MTNGRFIEKSTLNIYLVETLFRCLPAKNRAEKIDFLNFEKSINPETFGILWLRYYFEKEHLEATQLDKL